VRLEKKKYIKKEPKRTVLKNPLAYKYIWRAYNLLKKKFITAHIRLYNVFFCFNIYV
jgi:hypothetical protein